MHDGARPFVLADDIDSVNAAAAEFGAAVCGVRAVNTIKTLTPDGFIDETVNREKVVSVFTPQAFRRDIYMPRRSVVRKNRFIYIRTIRDLSKLAVIPSVLSNATAAI